MFLRTTESGWVVHAPAKINLALEVLGRQHDGYHQVETLLTPVRLFDSLGFCNSPEPLSLTLTPEPAAADDNSAGSAACDVPTDNTNLAVRAVQQLADSAGRPATGRLHLHKRIPIQAGLGGGSSDAAAALMLANHAWDLDYNRNRLASIASTLGADVPFFLYGGAAIGAGRGDQIQPTPIPAGLPIVIVKPPVGLPTPQVFEQLGLDRGQTLTPNHTPPASRCRQLAANLAAGRSAEACRGLIQNCLQPAAARLTDWVDRIAHSMAKLPVLAHQLTGSGSSYFAICRTWRNAQTVAAALRSQLTGQLPSAATNGLGLRVMTTQTCL